MMEPGSNKSNYPVPPLQQPFAQQVGKLSKENTAELIRLLGDRFTSIDEKQNAQYNLEELMVKNSHCDSYFVDNLRVQLFQMNTLSLTKELDSSPTTNYQRAVQEEIGCLVDAVVYNPGEYSRDEKERISTLRRLSMQTRGWIKSIKQIGKESVEGYALLSGITPSEDLFVVKVGRNPLEKGLIHEAAVGFYAINGLRKYIPNFMYTYSAFFCSPPYIKDKKPVTWCTGVSDPTTYVVFENIRGGVTFSSFAQKCSPKEFVTCYLQVVNALNVAYKYRDYTHYDLHSDNVLIRPITSNEVAIPYYGSGDFRAPPSQFIVSNNISSIIDYGFSHFKYEGINFGNWGFPGTHINPEKAFPINDAYKLLCFLGRDLYYAINNQEIMVKNAQRNPTISRLGLQKEKERLETLQSVAVLADTLYKFFVTSRDPLTIFERAKQQKATPNDFFDLGELWRSRPLDSLIQYIETKILPSYPGIITSTPKSGTITLNQDPSQYIFQNFVNFLSDRSRPPTNLFEYCQASSAVRNINASYEEKDAMMTWLNDHFDAEAEYLKYLPRAQDIGVKISREIQTITIPTLRNSSARTMILESSGYLDRLMKLLQLKEKQRIHFDFWVDEAICSLLNQSKLAPHQEEIERLTKYSRDFSAKYAILKNQAQDNFAWFSTINWNIFAENQQLAMYNIYVVMATPMIYAL